MNDFIGKNYTVPQLDLSVKPENTAEKYAYLYEQTVVDDSESYLGHPDSVLLKNGDILTVYPHGHGKGAVLNKISADGGRSYTKNIASPPESWKKSLETPTVYRLEFSDGTPDKLILISANSKWPGMDTPGGFNCSVSCDEGETWSEFETFYSRADGYELIPIVAMASLTRLKEHGTECYFEKENIWTFDGKGELLLTIMSSLAQEESRSISENCTWGQRKRFADGKVTVPFGRFLGYDRGEDGNLVVNPEQAKLVRRIYGLFLTGMSPTLIARTLTNEGIPTPSGKEKWYATSIKSILTNEKYKGDALLQKSYTTDFLTKKTKKNEGEIPQYYVKGNHEAIIDEKTFALVQTKMAARTKGQNRISSVSIFSSKIKCGDCGSWYGSKVWHSTDKYRRVIWQCNHKFDGEKCTTPTLTEDEMKRLFLQAANIAITEREELISVFESYMAPKLATDALERELAEVETELNVVSGLIDNCIHENARIALNQTAYQEQIAVLEARLNQAEAKKTEVIAEITRRQAKRQEIDQHFQYLRKLDLLTEFRDDDWLAMVDYMTVHRKDEVWVTFKDGSKIKAGL